MNHDTCVSLKDDDNLRLLSGNNKKTKWNSNINNIHNWNALPSVIELDSSTTTKLSLENYSSKAITSQPQMNPITPKSDTLNHSESINAISAELFDETLTNISPSAENADTFSNGSHDSFGGSTNRAFIGEEDQVTPRPHKMNYTCAHPETCTNCNNSIATEKIDQENDVIGLCPLPEVIEHEVIIIGNKHPMTSAPGKALRKLDPRKLNLTLDLFSSRTKKKEKNKSNNSSNNSSLSPKSSSPFSNVPTVTISENQSKPTSLSMHQCNVSTPKRTSSQSKTAETQATPKTSWLLRLFESQVIRVFAFIYVDCSLSCGGFYCKC